jgi:hypothetical protein
LDLEKIDPMTFHKIQRYINKIKELGLMAKEQDINNNELNDLNADGKIKRSRNESDLEDVDEGRKMMKLDDNI